MLRKSRIFVVAFFIVSLSIFVLFRITRLAAVDRTIPVIEMDNTSITISVDGGDDAILEGVTATDAKDGDISNNLFIESKTAFIENGRFNVTIAVADKDNHVTKVQREVIYSDYRSPQFSLTAPLRFQTTRESRDDLNIAANLSAKDVIDGNISNAIKISSDYSIYGNGVTTGEFPMEFLVTNSMGDTAKLPVTVTIYSAAEENGRPEIVLSDYVINTPVGKHVDIVSKIKQIVYNNSVYQLSEDGYFHNVEYDSTRDSEGFGVSAIQIDSNVNWDIPGVYEVKIRLSEEVAGISDFTRCYVVVY